MENSSFFSRIFVLTLELIDIYSSSVHYYPAALPRVQMKGPKRV